MRLALRVRSLERRERERSGGFCRCGGRVATELFVQGDTRSPRPGPKHFIDSKAELPPKRTCPRCGRGVLRVILRYAEVGEARSGAADSRPSMRH